MKATDFKREHFEKGRSFSRADFDAYIAASEKLAKTAGVKYLAFVGGGILLSFVFSQGIGGFIGNIMAVLCIFAGMIAGGVSNMKVSREVNSYAAKLGITKEDVKAARQHIKNGTVAWEAGAEMSDAESCAAERAEQQPVTAQSVCSLPEQPARAIWVAGFMIVAWVALVVLQCVFGFGARVKFAGTVFNADALMMSVAALIGTAAYLMTKPELKLRLFGGGIGLVTAVLNALSIAIMRNPQIYGPGVRLGELLNFRNVLFAKSFGVAFLFVLLALGAALLVSILYKGDDKRRSLRLSALAASGVYFVCNLVNTFVNPHLFLGSIQAVNIVSAVMSAVADAAVLFLICTAVYALCNMKTERVKLRGIGLIWAWLAAAGAVVSLIAAISAGTSGNNGVITYTAQFVLAISALTGYILLLCKKRVGLYVILIGVGMMLGAQAMGALGGVLAGARQYTVLLISSLLSALNPLFAWLAVKTADKRNVTAPTP